MNRTFSNLAAIPLRLFLPPPQSAGARQVIAAFRSRETGRPIRRRCAEQRL